ncbi:MAG: hypothetical protein WCG37_07800 [Actinomycetes bacterium]
MCRATTCKKCSRPTWRGCGAHIEQVLGDVPKSQRCQCSSKPTQGNGPVGEITKPKKRWFQR